MRRLLNNKIRILGSALAKLRQSATAGYIAAIAAILGVTGPLATMICNAPGASYVCSRLGAGGVPSEEEQAILDRRQPGDCKALETYLRLFPKGAYADVTSRLLQAREQRIREDWQNRDRLLELSVRIGEGLLSRESAEGDALSRGAIDAELVCRPYSQLEGFRLVAVQTKVRNWRCSKHVDSIACGFDGEAICTVSERHRVTYDYCP